MYLIDDEGSLAPILGSVLPILILTLIGAAVAVWFIRRHRRHQAQVHTLFCSTFPYHNVRLTRYCKVTWFQKKKEAEHQYVVPDKPRRSDINAAVYMDLNPMQQVLLTRHVFDTQLCCSSAHTHVDCKSTQPIL